MATVVAHRSVKAVARKMFDVIVGHVPERYASPDYVDTVGFLENVFVLGFLQGFKLGRKREDMQES